MIMEFRGRWLRGGMHFGMSKGKRREDNVTNVFLDKHRSELPVFLPVGKKPLVLSSDGLISDLLITFLIRRLIKRLKLVFQVMVLTCVVMFSYTRSLTPLCFSLDTGV